MLCLPILIQSKAVVTALFVLYLDAEITACSAFCMYLQPYVGYNFFLGSKSGVSYTFLQTAKQIKHSKKSDTISRYAILLLKEKTYFGIYLEKDIKELI